MLTPLQMFLDPHQVLFEKPPELVRLQLIHREVSIAIHSSSLLEGCRRGNGGYGHAVPLPCGAR